MHNSTNTKNKKVSVAITQFSSAGDMNKNIKKAKSFINASVKEGANIILLQELFMSDYFCQTEDEEMFNSAISQESHILDEFKVLAENLEVVLVISFFESVNQVFFNSVIVYDATGESLGIYRKNHIPDGPGYEEKFYFTPGNRGYPVFETEFGKIGVGICWDQWFPEVARILTLKGANMIFYPTAIGSEPHKEEYNSRLHWQRVMQGHAAANMVPVIVSNRVGKESINESVIYFYGSSFITDAFGEIVCSLNQNEENYKITTIDLEENDHLRRSWGIFRDRRPSTYQELLTKDGLIKER